MSLFPLRLAAFLSGSKSSSRDQPPVLLEYRSSTVFIVFAVCLAVFTDILLYGLVVPVIPFSITVRAGVSEGQAQQWTAILLACYTGALFIASPFVGIYADHTASRRLPLLLGLLALAGSTVLLCLGRCVALLIVGRLLQGLSAAIVWSVGLALLADTMGGNVGVAMGYVSIAMSLGFFVAPMLGGAVYATAGFYAVFYVAFGVIFLDIVVRLVLIEKKVARQWLPEDTSGGGVSQGSKGMATDSSPNSAVPDEPHLSPAGTQHPYLTLCKSRRLLASLFGCFLISGLM